MPCSACTKRAESGDLPSDRATQFKNKSLIVPEELAAREVCACCLSGPGCQEKAVCLSPKVRRKALLSQVCEGPVHQSSLPPGLGRDSVAPGMRLGKWIAIQPPLTSWYPWDILTNSGKDWFPKSLRRNNTIKIGPVTLKAVQQSWVLPHRNWPSFWMRP